MTKATKLNSWRKFPAIQYSAVAASTAKRPGVAFSSSYVLLTQLFVLERSRTFACYIFAQARTVSQTLVIHSWFSYATKFRTVKLGLYVHGLVRTLGYSVLSVGHGHRQSENKYIFFRIRRTERGTKSDITYQFSLQEHFFALSFVLFFFWSQACHPTFQFRFQFPGTFSSSERGTKSDITYQFSLQEHLFALSFVLFFLITSMSSNLSVLISVSRHVFKFTMPWKVISSHEKWLMNDTQDGEASSVADRSREHVEPVLPVRKIAFWPLWLVRTFFHFPWGYVITEFHCTFNQKYKRYEIKLHTEVFCDYSIIK